jgi:RHS repeat-associated protein
MLQGRKFGYAYDDRGNRTRTFLSADQSKRWEFTWDGENKLTQAKLMDGAATLRTVSFKYDPFGRRVEKKVEGQAPQVPVPLTTTYTYDGEDIVLQLEGDGTTTTSTQYLHGPGIDQPLAIVEGGQSFYDHADGLGSIVAISDIAKNIVARYSYDAFGSLNSTAPEFGSAYAFTGREWDLELGLYYYRARYYDPMEGRFISKDPIGFAGGDVNVYRYVGNDVVMRTDSFGLYAKDVHLDLTYSLARAVGLNRCFANKISRADQGVDDNFFTTAWGRPGPLAWFFGASFHFQPRSYAQVGLQQAIDSGDAGQFGKFLHIMQDSYSHSGYGFPFGHIFDGTIPDKYNTADSRDWNMRNETLFWLREFNKDMDNVKDNECVKDFRCQ